MTFGSLAARHQPPAASQNTQSEGDMRDFKSLVAWQSAHKVALEAYRVTTDFPPAERYGLTSQIRKAAVSIGSNIAEGCGRRSQRELAHFLQISIGSANEMEYQLLLARDLGFLAEAKHEGLIRDLSKARQMLTVLTRRVERDARVERVR